MKFVSLILALLKISANISDNVQRSETSNKIASNLRNCLCSSKFKTRSHWLAGSTNNRHNNDCIRKQTQKNLQTVHSWAKKMFSTIFKYYSDTQYIINAFEQCRAMFTDCIYCFRELEHFHLKIRSENVINWLIKVNMFLAQLTIKHKKINIGKIKIFLGCVNFTSFGACETHFWILFDY